MDVVHIHIFHTFQIYETVTCMLFYSHVEPYNVSHIHYEYYVQTKSVDKNKMTESS